MIVLPNSFEKYVCHLRNFTLLSMLKQGVLPKHLKNLKKIYIAEAFLYQNNTEPLNLQLLSFNLLFGVKTLKKFDFQLDIPRNVLINERLYSALILTLAKTTDFLKIKLKNGIIIKGHGEIKNSRKIVAYLNGCSFFDIKSMNYIIHIPCKETRLSSIPTVSQWELLFDKFSILNLLY